MLVRPANLKILDNCLIQWAPVILHFIVKVVLDGFFGLQLSRIQPVLYMTSMNGNFTGHVLDYLKIETLRRLTWLRGTMRETQEGHETTRRRFIVIFMIINGRLALQKGFQLPNLKNNHQVSPKGSYPKACLAIILFDQIWHALVLLGQK